MAKESLSITIDKDLIAILDAMVKSNKFRNRSHAAEFLLENGIEQSKKGEIYDQY